MKIFLDANIIVSVLNKEYPVYGYTSRILSLANNKRFQLFTSPVCLAIAFYFSEKKSGTSLAKTKIEILSKNISIAGIGEKEVLLAITNKKVKDFEDGLEYYAAFHHKCNYIITEDVSDFYFSEIAVVDSKTFIERLIDGKL